MLRLLTKPAFLLFVFLSVGFVVRFYNLDWGTPWFFHPDERNIASAISQLSFPQQLNPHFFAYGSLPIYLAYIFGVLINSIYSCQQSLASCHLPASVPLEQAILILRFFSAFLSILLILLIYNVGKKLKNETVGLIAAFLATTSIGLTQFAHFGTFEMWLTTGSLLFFLFSILYIDKPHILSLLGLTFSFTMLVATKISSLTLLPLLLIFLALPFKEKKQSLKKIILTLIIAAILTLGFYIFTNPYVLLDFRSFTSSISYEANVATGETKVFYTGEFFKALPVVFPFIRIYPFLLNPIVFVLFFPTILILSWVGIKEKQRYYLLLLGFFSILFFSQTFLFAQWTRYFLPTLPFIFLIVALGIEEIFAKLKKHLSQTYLIKPLLISSLIVISSLFIFAFVKTVYINPDTRVAAKAWATDRIPSSSPILSEVYDLGIVSFNESFSNITLFNFYDLDNNSSEYNQESLNDALSQTEYIVLPSQRLLKTRLMNAKDFPVGNRFYTQLNNRTLGFKQIYETPCDIWCTLVYWGDSIDAFEQTTTIFDRPTVFIFSRQ